MTVVVCTDSRGGMLFMGRRVSRDREMIADLATLGGRLLCHPFSEKYLRTTPLTFSVEEELLEVAKEGDVCFVEHLPLAPHLDRIDRLIVYSWGEAYPYDFALDVDTGAPPFRLIERREFPGYSHKTITREIYEL